MGKWKSVKESDRPHEILEMMLQGAKVPKGFKCDGCSSSPDLHFVWACNIHDFDSRNSSNNWKKLMDVARSGVDHDKVVENFMIYSPEMGRYVSHDVTLKRGFELWFIQFDEMAYRLQHNIKILSKFEIKDGYLAQRSRFSSKRFLGYKLSRMYSTATHLIFTKWAE